MAGSTERWRTPSPGKDGGADDAPGRGAFWRDVGYLTSLGWMMALPIAVAVIVGWLVDRHLGTAPAWTLTLLGAGIGIAVIQAFSTMRDALRRRRHD